MNNNQKVLWLYNFLMENTNEENFVTLDQIKENYKEVSNDSKDIDSKTIKSIINFIEKDLKIEVYKGSKKPVSYAIIEREFEIVEIKALLDALDSAQFISEKKTKDLKNKLIRPFSKMDREKLLKEVNTYGLPKVEDNIYYNIDAINQAINEKKSIEFKYTTYFLNKNGKLEKKYKHKNMTYIISPYKLVWNDQRYYMIGYNFDLKHQKICSYRVDRMDKVKISEHPYRPLREDINKHVNRAFKMFDSKRYDTILKFKANKLDNIVDYYGDDINVEKIDDEYYKVKIDGYDSPTFYSWIFTFGNEIEIVEPNVLKEGFNKMIKKFKEE